MSKEAASREQKKNEIVNAASGIMASEGPAAAVTGSDPDAQAQIQVQAQKKGKDRTLTVGFMRRTKSGHGLKVDIALDEISKLKSHDSADGKRFARVVLNADFVRAILDGTKEVTRLSGFLEGEEDETKESGEEAADRN